MEVHIDEIVSTVRAVDDQSVLGPETLGAIVEAVMSALDERELHRERTGAERNVTGGVREEQLRR